MLMLFGYSRTEAREMTDVERLAEIIGSGIARGGVYDWDNHEWTKQPQLGRGTF